MARRAALIKRLLAEIQQQVFLLRKILGLLALQAGAGE